MADGCVLTAEKLAQRLSLEPSTIRRWTKERKIPVLNLSSTVRRYVWGDVLAALRRLDANRRAEAEAEEEEQCRGKRKNE